MMKLLTVAELADLLSVTDITVRRMVIRGQIPAVRIGRAVRFRQEDVDAFLTSVRIQPTAVRKDGKPERLQA